ncbi:D12 class N6 adenine-specific DNA methyltransferase [Andreesenia angusta]|uniref:site-specific DNA-methyltransferase (adenine-specific) n=1 Tax=Andreesenia angusta TaxID=39480 RepID=A0A1S1V710_9FIRM|nr:DNA adenine methylase [Andreesenia angusta]OHW62205.1 D12 class N6 adenine-specific DNA methyltransferase [Andreesenia angusta]
MSNILSNSPLRYPGGKSKLYSYTKDLISKNNLDGCTYVEPFAGGCGLAITLLLQGVVSKLVLNDIDRSIYAFWYSVLNHTDELCKLIVETPITVDQWNIQKRIQNNKEIESLLSLGFSTFFLNRTNRSGVIAAGPIGGKSQNGNYKIDCRFNKKDLIDRILEISKHKNNISFYNYDASYFLKRVVSRQRKDTFIFFDPPYYEKGPGLYLNHFKHDDHEALARVIEKSKQLNWVVTYDNNSKIKDIYSKFDKQVYSLRHTAHTSKQGSEVMIYSDKIQSVPFRSE